MKAKQGWKYKEASSLLIKNGFRETRKKGDHHIFERDGRIVSIPQRPNAMIMRRIIKENDLIV